MWWITTVVAVFAVLDVLLVVWSAARLHSARMVPYRWTEQIAAQCCAAMGALFFTAAWLVACIWRSDQPTATGPGAGSAGVAFWILTILGVVAMLVLLTFWTRSWEFRNTWLFRKKPTRGWLVSYGRAVLYPDYEPSKYCFSRMRRRLGLEHFVRGWTQRTIAKKWSDGRYFHVKVDMVATGGGSPAEYVSACETLEELLEKIAADAQTDTADEVKRKFDTLPITSVVELRRGAVTLAVPKVIVPANFVA